MPKIEINCHNEALFNDAIMRMKANDPGFVDLLLDNSNALDALSLADMLKVNFTLKSLEIAHGDYLHDLGAEYIAGALKVNKTLSKLHLRSCAIRDEGAASLAAALRINRSLTHLDLRGNSLGNQSLSSLADSLERNFILTKLEFIYADLSPANINRINALIGRNKAFLAEAVRNFTEGNVLTARQNKTLLAHINSEDPEILRILPQEIRKHLNMKFSQSMGDIRGNIVDPARVMSEFLPEISQVSFVTAVGEKVIRTNSPAGGYFRGKVRITQAIHDGFNQMMANAGDLASAVNSPNNAIFIADALNKDRPFEQINENLAKIKADPKAKEFALSNPKKLGYLMTLEKEKLDKAIGILNHPKLGEFIRKKPKEIATLLKVSDDPEKLFRAVKEIDRNPHIQSVKMVVSASDEKYIKAHRNMQAIERRSISH